MKIFYRLILGCSLFYSANSFGQQSAKSYPDYLQPDHAINAVTMVMVHDVVSPPVAARYYAYATMAAYNIVSANNKKVPALQKIVKSYRPGINLDTVKLKYDHRIAAYYSILEIARMLLPSGFMLKDDQDNFVQLLQKTHVDQRLIDNSIQVGLWAASDVIAFSKTDHYNKLSTLKRYTPLNQEGKWYPTPPGYFEAVEPNWKTIRTMVIDSSNQFKPVKVIPFSKDTTSEFFHLVKTVYDASNHLTTDQINQALFWDCNPFAIATSGHMAIGYKKISPGGHWMHVASLVSQKANLSFDQTIEVLSMEGITLMDAFIACWEEKYASNRLRPENFINKYMDVKWAPVLQTPPFPEYTSGHAVISNASAELLTYLLGDNFEYRDNTEVPFGSGERDFKSFRKAAAEASMSRFYGGIHYMDSIENGNTQGKQVGNYVVDRIQSAGIKPFKN